MSLALQAKILRALQEREVERVGGAAAVPIDVRVVAATNRTWDRRWSRAASARTSSTAWRWSPFASRRCARAARTWSCSPRTSSAHYARTHGRPVRAIAEETLFEVLRDHPWPGNVRQLRNAVERAVVMCEGEVLLPRHLPADVRRADVPAGALGVPQERLRTLAEMEQSMIRRALQETGQSLTAAAERLGIHRNTLRRKILDYGLREP
jgi:two-component system, NtrC family, response regulator HydG